MSSEAPRVRPTIAVMFGGRSLEHDVSVVSGLQILHAIDPERFAPMPIYIDQQTRWWVGDDLWHNDTFKRGGPNRDRLIEVTLSSGFGSSRLVPVNQMPLAPGTAHVVGGVTLGEHGSIPVDCFVPVLHGTYGEDGCVQGALELGGCAYVGCGVMASAIGMNKRATKIMAQHAGVPVVRWLSLERAVLDRGHEWLTTFPAQVADTFGWPVIVKPCNLGSSAGVSVAANAEDLIAGVLKVFEYDVEALIEPFIKNRLEINVAVAGLEQPVASVTEMPVTNQASPLTFAEKYRRQGRKSIGSQGMAGALRVLDPQDLPAEVRANAQRYATTVFSVLGCEGISRIDFLIDADTGELFFNEINTLPGSLAFYLWSAAPHYWTITDLLARLIDRAQRLRAMKRGLQRKPPAELELLR
ncbi:MAG: D-alanine--D-alanine ligase [Acidobacteria bacterium]|nr:D-alanine--D-alanine ligase [Acidobacteriota bacterium]